ncbi:hypothetical protein [Paenibacillus cremeus]|uniref:Uncharacterized protein n=1 Tax=Paenibacillus cremeus TaxID=2163881 RepID=A0A559JNQ2_9BACL|nr:hypothetical protein [Paenibacillus cremeus]TVY01495.1 hypothetical protein FPZ49_32375 [Paenibacillus cremeus]
MATFTAQVLVGQSHTYDGGIINLHHTLYLSENSVARWLLCSVDPYGAHTTEQARGWIPHPDSILEDGLLLLGLHVWRNEKLLAMAKEVFLQPVEEVDCINNHTISTENLKKLHEECREILVRAKMVLTLFEGSSLFRELGILQQYQMELEVCSPCFNRYWNPWSSNMEIRGVLEKNKGYSPSDES